MAGPVLTLNLLLDEADLWPRAAKVLGDQVRLEDSHDPEVIGIVGWTSATRPEVARLEELRDQHAGPIVALLAEMPAARGARAVNAVVDGAVLAREFRRALWPTLVAVASGQCVVPRSVRRALQRPPLSPRERQVLAMVVLDFSNAEIARKLVVTESNVKSHLTSAFSKLGVSSRSAAAELILDQESGLGPGILRISPEE
ncbi:MAG TPA: LuxR C-terminal-related transcriptional regulator [Solirubrobacteraceae bacterium]|nr:LuxR C-terminal-related transcriptional regulator [Solirubrobacteraceae bacterium]